MPSKKTPASRRILKLPEVRARVCLGRDTIYRGAREGWFPKPVKLVPNGAASGWFEDEISAYLDSRAAERETSAA